MKKFLLVALFFLLSGCGNNTGETKLTTDDVIKAFQKAGLPIGRIEVYSEETDPEHLLGRPGHYIGKCAWEDTRYRAKTPEEQAIQDVFFKSQGANGLTGGFIEAFESQDELQSREKLLRTAYENNPLVFQYIFVHKNIILRIDQEITPQQAEEYKSVLNNI